MKNETNLIPVLAVTPAKAPVVSGKFEQIKTYLQKWKKKVLAMELTEDNMAEVRTIKKEAVQYRNSLAKIQTDTKKLYFNDPKAVFDAQMGELLAVVGEVEKAADQVLSVEEKQRIDEVNQVLDHYKTELQDKYKLEEDYLSHIEYKKDFYNKTTPKGYTNRDKYWKDNLEEQFKELKKEQSAYAANVRLIETSCKDEPRLNVQHWIDRLKYHDVATVLEMIVEEKNRLNEIDQQPSVTSSQSVQDTNFDTAVAEAEIDTDAKTTILGVAHNINFESDFKDRLSSMNIQITYPCDLGDALTELFKVLTPYGIKVKKIKEVIF
jgi:hypothetical protein